MNFRFELFTISIVLLIVARRSESIMCYNCAGCSNPANNATDNPTNCSVLGTKYNTCAKVSLTYPGGGVSMKNCITNTSCSSNSLIIAGYGYSFTCCNTDYCNSVNLISINYKHLLGAISVWVISIKILKNV